MEPSQSTNNDALKAQVDAEIEARLRAEEDYARYIHRRGVHVDGLNLLFDMEATSEVAEMPPLYRLPGAPAGVIGLANRHGRVVPVVDLTGFFGLKHDRAESEWLLVCGFGEDAVGLVINSLPERKRFVQGEEVGADEIGVVSIEHPISGYAKAVYRESADGESRDIWIDLDTEALFSAVFKVGTTFV